MNPDYIHKYVGNFDTYYETGMEGNVAAVFNDVKGRQYSRSFNPETEKWDGPMRLTYSLSFTIWLGKFSMYKAKIFDKTGDVFYEGPLTMVKDKRELLRNGLSFIPNEISLQKWKKILQESYKGEIESNDVTPSFLGRYDVPNELWIGREVTDLVTGKKELIFGMKAGDNDKVVLLLYSNKVWTERNLDQVKAE